MLSWEYPPHVNGGLGSHVKALIPALAELGVCVHLVTPRFNGGEPVEVVGDDFTVHRVEVPPWQTGDVITDAHEVNSRLSAYSERLIEEHGSFDVIHAHDWLVALSAFHFKHEYKWPLVATVHATERGRHGGSVNGPVSVAIDHIEWRLCYETWRIIVPSRYMGTQLAGFFRVPLGKVDVVPNGVDLSRYRSLHEADLTAFRRRYADDGQRLVFHIGRLVHEKGARTLVAAAPSVLAEFPSARFVIAGRGPMYQELQDTVSDLGLSDQVDFLGFVSDSERDRLYRVADVAVFPSLYEPFGIVALEAMAAGAPVVASEAGGLAEVVESQETGVSHVPGDPGSLASAICQTLRSPEQAQVWARNALERIRTIYSWEQIAQETTAVYRRVVKERGRVDW